jgi:hypothetical protein
MIATDFPKVGKSSENLGYGIWSQIWEMVPKFGDFPKNQMKIASIPFRFK